MALDRFTAYLRTAKTLTDIQYERVRGVVSPRPQLETTERQLETAETRGPSAQTKKTRLQLVFLSCAVCGIEFCYAAETAFVSPTLLKIGVPMAYMSLAWCLSPLLGLLLSPVLGSISDRCTSRLGRRRPFIIALSVGIVAGLLLVPNGKDLGGKFGDPDLYTECNCSNTSQIQWNNETTGAPDVILTTEESEVREHRSNHDVRRSWASYFIGNLRPRVAVDRPRKLSQFSFAKAYRRLSSKIGWLFKLDKSEKRISKENKHLKRSFLELGESTEEANLDQTMSSVSSRSDSKESEQLTSESIKSQEERKENSEADVCQSIDDSMSLDVAAESGVGRDHCLVFRRPVLGILFTVLGVVLLDCCCDACQSPCRAYLLDVSLPEDHAAGLSTFTVMAGLGGSLGYLLGGVDWERTHLGQKLGGHVRIVFTLVLVIYIVCVSLTIASVKEIPIEKAREQDKQSNKTKIKGRKYRKFTNEDSDDDNNEEEKEIMETLGSHVNCGSSDYGSQRCPTPIQQSQSFKPPDCPVENGESKSSEPLASDGVTREASEETILDMSEISLGTYVKSIFRMPRSLSVLCRTNFFCWMSLVCYSLYFTDFVGQSVMGGDPKASVGTPEHRRYDEGVRLGSIGMSLYSLSCSIYSMNIKKLVNKFGRSHSTSLQNRYLNR